MSASLNDAITNMTLNLRESRIEMSYGNIYNLREPEESARRNVKQLVNLRQRNSEDIIIYNSSHGIPQVAKWLRSRSEK
jgi:hypothetical protein